MLWHWEKENGQRRELKSLLSSAGSAHQMATRWAVTNQVEESQLRRALDLWPHPTRENSIGRCPKMVRDTVTSLPNLCVWTKAVVFWPTYFLTGASDWREEQNGYVCILNQLWPIIAYKPWSVIEYQLWSVTPLSVIWTNTLKSFTKLEMTSFRLADFTMEYMSLWFP